MDGIPVIDREAALERQEGDLEFLRELWKVFVEDARSKKQKLLEAMKKNDLVSIERFSHSLKSGAATVGAKRVRERALQLESLARSVKSGDLAATHALLQQELDLAINALHRELEGGGDT